ncbi:hypothetical protein [Maricaulis salignorans]|uniref:hypothetical protein n=1 Tax=Maricaulis salignorans TaxID=144026 RepID=UPI003A8C8AFD
MVSGAFFSYFETALCNPVVLRKLKKELGLFDLILRVRERFRVGTLLDMYARRGAVAAHQYYLHVEASQNLPRTPVYRVMAKLVELDCLLDKYQFEDASVAASKLINEELATIKSVDDREYLHLLIEGSFNTRRYYPNWLTSQARAHSFNPDGLDFFLRKKIAIQTVPASD